jgi:hypothetical protein
MKRRNSFRAGAPQPTGRIPVRRRVGYLVLMRLVQGSQNCVCRVGYPTSQCPDLNLSRRGFLTVLANSALAI